MRLPFSIAILRMYKLLITVLILLSILFFLYAHRKGSPSTAVEKTQNIKKAKPSLTFKNRVFYLNGKPLQILSGTVHYFRVPQAYWHDRLMKLKAAGLNTVETYSPWNLHEESRGSMNFEGMLNVRKFFQLAKKLNLYVIFRPGPFICSEWDFGGLPAWLLTDPKMRVRSTYAGFTEAMDSYFKVLVSQVADLQWSSGGPIIAVQVENEYGSYGKDQSYMLRVRDSLRRSGIVEAFFTSDGNEGIAHVSDSLPGAFAGINYNSVQDGKRLATIVGAWVEGHLPLFATELWTGWFLAWADTKDDAIDTDRLLRAVRVLLQRSASLNLYMLHGGTNFGFLNGFDGMRGVPLVTSYDYGAPIAENGAVTDKFVALQRLLHENLPPSTVRRLPALPPPIPASAYGRYPIKQMMKWHNVVELAERRVISSDIKFMEDVGQNFGFILYRSRFDAGRKLKIHGRVADRGIILVNEAPLSSTNVDAGVIYDPKSATAAALASGSVGNVGASVSLAGSSVNAAGNALDILVENLGRVNFAPFQSQIFNVQRKGISVVDAKGIQTPGSVSVDDKTLGGYTIVSLDFKPAYLARASVTAKAWTEFSATAKAATAPGLYRTELVVPAADGPADTFLDMSDWVKGVVFVNGFNIGRYWNVGPQRTLYLPAPVLRKGSNEVIVFELHRPADALTFVNRPKFTLAR